MCLVAVASTEDADSYNPFLKNCPQRVFIFPKRQKHVLSCNLFLCGHTGQEDIDHRLAVPGQCRQRQSDPSLRHAKSPLHLCRQGWILRRPPGQDG